MTLREFVALCYANGVRDDDAIDIIQMWGIDDPDKISIERYTEEADEETGEKAFSHFMVKTEGFD